MKVRMIVHHLATDNFWYGQFAELTKDEYEHAEGFLQEIATSGEYLNLETDKGRIIFPKDIIKQCVMALEESAE